MIDPKKIAVIHIVKKELALPDDAYRKILFEVAGVRSSKDLDDAGFRRLMNYFVRSPHYRVNAHGLTFRQKFYIQFLSDRMEWDADHLRNFLHKYYHKARIEDLTKKEAIKVIESLKNVMRHAAPPRGPEAYSS